MKNFYVVLEAIQTVFKSTVLQYLNSLEIKNIQLIAMQQTFPKPKTMNYSKIPLTSRIKLAELVNQSHMSIAKASKELGIKNSTAKLIMRKYREQGTFFEKIEDKMQRMGCKNLKTSIPISETPNLSGRPEMPQILPMPTDYFLFVQDIPICSYLPNFPWPHQIYFL